MTETPIFLAPDQAANATPLDLVGADGWEAIAAGLSAPERTQALRERFTGQAGAVSRLSDAQGALARVLFGLGAGAPPPAMGLRALPGLLPAGDYRIDRSPPGFDGATATVAWALGARRFDRYRRVDPAARPPAPARLAPPAGVDPAEAGAVAAACNLARDMIDTPANDMGPAAIEAIAREMADGHGAALTVTPGDGLLAAGYPAVHAVGRAAAPERAPRMIEMAWGEPGRPLVALVGKGVVFDSGGLDIKPSSGMRLMKKDMGGAAHALALASMVMAAGLPIRLAVLLPVVENAIAGDAMRPGDVLASRAGLSIEVGNTDAEGRLILADALTRAGELAPALTLDFATLTGAARVALGPQVVPFWTNDNGLAAEIAAAGRAAEDPLWRMPLWQGYAPALDSDIADIRNDSDAWAQAGAIIAALFLQRFAPKGAWAHFDLYAWNPRARPGWPQGGEAQAIRALYAVLKARFG